MEGEDIAVPAVFVISRDKRILFERVGETAADRVGVGTLLEEVDKARAK
jgi:hypothetical protein